MLRIRKYDFSDEWVDVTYDDGGNTVFGEFSADGRRMAQQPSRRNAIGRML